MIAITKGTTSYRGIASVNDLLPNEVAFSGTFAWLDQFTPGMVWDDGLQNVRPLTAQEISQADSDKQATADREAKIQAVIRAQAVAIVDGATDPAAIVAAASQAAVAVASPAVKVKP